ncbi:Flp family type IVb pilin [Arthrobacter sp. efr-133-R2A-120]|uniref:Flp family type IVb pilin n=1 Tax=Arthrobacter sp. efr-133-R2A-120 TaxID=3040277 RepID=UPI00254DFFBD|nr:Flp family type IVb pilin [Arthrobacter sp. efr-133-R2A-120]
MFNINTKFKRISLALARISTEKGATATEYSLLVGLIALVIVGGVGLFGGNLNTFFSSLATTVGTW